MLDQLPINNDKKKFSILEKLYKITIVEKFMNPVGVIFFLLAAVFFSFLTIKLGLAIAALLLVAIIGVPLVYGMVVNLKIGVMVLLTASYFIMLLIKFDFTTFPLGTLIDAIEGLLILGFFIKQKQHKDFSMFNNKVTFVILAWIGYNLLEVLNPSASSTLAWVYTIRSVAFVTLMYFVFLYSITSIKFLRFIIITWLVFSIIGGIYGIRQEIFGYAAFEQRILDADPERASLYFILGHWRKFSIYNDPVVFAYNMVLSTLLCIGLMWGVTQKWKKYTLLACCILFCTSMLFSGTRAAFALIPAGMILYFILNFNKKIMIFAVISGLFFLALIIVPTSNATLQRFQTAFKPSNDASFIVRQRNQAFIKPYIHTHPMGGGLGSVGVWGKRFSPDSMLAHFPPDSTYVRVAVEMGWIGVIFFCTMMFIILKTGIDNFYKIKNKELKTYCLAMTIMIFAINVGSYPQESIVQYPTSVYFYLMVAIVNKCLDLDKELDTTHQPKPQFAV